MSDYKFSTHTSVILLAKMKGGVGATHVAMALAAEFARRGAEVGVQDADLTTLGATRWFSSALSDNPDEEPPYSVRKWDPEKALVVEDAIRFSQNNELDVLIIDTGADRQRLVELAKLATVFVGPTGTTDDELAPHKEAYDLARGIVSTTPWLSLLTRVKQPKRGEAITAREDLINREHPVQEICDIEIPRHAMYSSMSGSFADDVGAYTQVVDYLIPLLKRPLEVA